MRVQVRAPIRVADSDHKPAPARARPAPSREGFSNRGVRHSFANIAVHCSDAALPPTAVERERALRTDLGGRAVPPDVVNRLDSESRATAHLARLHTDSPAERRADALSARAYTVGAHVYFSSGAYEPGTSRGLALLAHELYHVREQVLGRDPGRIRVQRALAAPPTRLETSTIPASAFPTETEAELDAAIKRRLTDPWPGGAGQYLASVDFPGLPALGTKVSDVDASAIRRAVKWALLDNIRDTKEAAWVNTEMHLRVNVESGFGNTNAMVVLRTDAQRNAEVGFAGISVQGKGAVAEPDALKSELKDTRGVVFVETDAQNVKVPTMPKAVTFLHKAWDSGPELALLRTALGLLGGTEQGIIKGMSFRRLQGNSAGGAGGFYSSTDNSVNLFDAALPVSMDEWYRIGGSFESGGVRTALHEIGHALAHAQAQPQPAGPALTIERAFRNAVLANWQARNPPSQTFPPPKHIPLPTTYSASGWGEFFAETYSIFKTNPQFVQTAEFQYLFDFFAGQFP